MRERDGFLRRLEETLSRAAAWIAERRHAGEQPGSRGEHDRVDALRRAFAEARRAIRETGRADLARARESLDDLKRDYDVPPPRTALTRGELQALREHLHTTARLMGDLSNLDSPNWNEAHEEYERSWAEVERARSEGASASP